MYLINNNIVLRSIEIEDAHILRQMINDPKLENLVVGWSQPVSLHYQIEWIKNISNDFRYMIDFADVTVGTCSITNVDYKNSTASLNIKLCNENYKGKGIGTSVIDMLLNYCFNELNLNNISASILDYNAPSLSLFNKCGFTQEGVLKNRVFKNGKYHNLVVLSISRDEYIK